MSRTVKTPPQFEAIFDKAEEYFSRFFQRRRDDPAKGAIEISNERFVLVRGAALSIEFFEVVKRLFTHSEQEATSIASRVLFDIAHALGKTDACHFHKSMGLSDPVSKLSAGPVYFAHTGWAFVDISEESKPQPNENYYLLYNHPHSFEADAWIEAGRRSDFPVCLMNAGYSAGWCEESFGLPLVATEVSCRARGDDACRFIMAPPDRIEAHVSRYLERAAERGENIPGAEFWKSFQRDWVKEALLEKTLRASEGDYRNLFEASPDAIVVWTPNGVVQAANRAAATLLGYEKAEDLVGRRWMDFVIPEDRADRAEATRRAEKSGGLSAGQFRMQRKDGSHLFVEGRLFAALDSAGNPVRTIAIARDVTDRKRAEEALRDSERAYRDLFELSPDGIIAWDLNGVIQAANPPAATLLGYDKPEDLVGKPWLDFINPEERSALAEKVRRAQESAGTIEAEFQAVRKNGSRAFFQSRLHVTLDETANSVRSIAITRDITDRKRAEEAVYLSEARFRSAFEFAGHGMALVDMDGRFLRVNAAYCRITGYSEDELLARTFADITYPEDVAENVHIAQRMRAREISAFQMEKRYVRKDGGIVWVQLNVSTVRDAAGAPTHQITHAQDITARKAGEEAMYLSEARFRGAFEFAGHGMALVGLDGRFLRVNPAFCRNAGYSEDELLARTFMDLIFPEDLGDIVKNVLRLNSGEIPSFETEIRYLRKDREIAWIQLNSSMVHDAAGAPSYHIIHALDITARKAAEAALRAQARHDQLTGLPNRHAFLERLKEAFASSRRGAEAFAVLYLDLDGFKDVNDTLGHAEGDRLLQAVAARLKSNVRETDYTARFGGDEFAVLQTGLNDPSDAGALAAELTKCLAAPYRLDDNEVRITASVGISFFDSRIADPDDMLTQADLALYRAKEEGRDRYCFHSTELDRNVRERVTLTNELRAALENHELELYYQPQVELASGRIVGLEALVRWNHPQRGLLTPDVFIPIAERTGSIFALGRWVLGQACRQIKAWRDQGIAPPLLAINVSAAELHDYAKFEQFLAESLQQWGVAPGDIELELTESVLMETTQMHSDALARIKELGTSIAIDDFGTGYSSLAYLTAYPLSRLKIAQQFVVGIPDNAGDVAITKATLSLARELGVKVIAEGIETKAQLDFLVSAGCTVGQGFCFSRAVQAGCATELLRRGFIDPAFADADEMRQLAAG
jgi:diguanylate cyclase (GGDEF)-like protein/PAS domain S-box-containing protein